MDLDNFEKQEQLILSKLFADKKHIQGAMRRISSARKRRVKEFEFGEREFKTLSNRRRRPKGRV